MSVSVTRTVMRLRSREFELRLVVGHELVELGCLGQLDVERVFALERHFVGVAPFGQCSGAGLRGLVVEAYAYLLVALLQHPAT